MVQAASGTAASVPNSLARIRCMATLDHLPGRRERRQRREDRAQALLANRAGGIHGFQHRSASAVKAFGSLSLSDLNLFGSWLSLLVKENCRLLGRTSRVSWSTAG